MERGREAERSVGTLLPFSSMEGVRSRARARPGYAGGATPTDRHEERAFPSAHLRPQLGWSIQDVLAGAACFAIWGLLWVLITFAVASPLGSILSQPPQAGAATLAHGTSDRRAPNPRRELPARMRSVSSARLVDPAPSCEAGFVAVDGRCELGEEIEIRPPAGWRRP